MDCQVCGKAGNLPCPGCGALFYCGKKHLSRHRRQWHGDEECSRMRRQMEAGAAMEAKMPFSWHKGPSHRGSMANSVGDSTTPGSTWRCQLLKRAGLHGLGMWRRECVCCMEQPWGSVTDQGRAISVSCPSSLSCGCPCAVDSGDGPSPSGRPEPDDAVPDSAGVVGHAPGTCDVPTSTSEGAPGNGPWEGGRAWEELCHGPQLPSLPSTTSSHLRGWSAFCSACCLAEPETSPLPLLLSAPLTLAAAISRQKAQLCRSEGGDSPLKAGSSSPRSPFVVHWLGPQKELDQIPAIAAAAAGIGHETPVVVRLVGPDVPPSWEGQCWDVPNPFVAAGRALRDVVQTPSRLCPSTPRPPLKPGCVRVTCHPGAYHERFACRWTPHQTSSAASSPELGNAYDDTLIGHHQQVGVEDELPDLVFAPNAGVPAYSSWAASLEALTSPGAPPCLFTDYTEEAASMASAAVVHASEKHQSRCVMTSRGSNDNKATGDSNVPSSRRPSGPPDAHHLRIRVQENSFLCSTMTPSGTALPTYSNGWLIGWNGALQNE